MARLMKGNGSFFIFLDDLVLFFQSADDPVDGIQEVLSFNSGFVHTGSDQGCFITYIGNVGT